MKKTRFFIVLILTANSFAQSAGYSPKIQLALETYTYLRGQDLSLCAIARQFPELGTETDSVQLAITNSWLGKAKTNLETFLITQLGNENFTALDDQVESFTNRQFERPIEKVSYARNFLAEIGRRLNGNIEPPTKERIQAFAYDQFPDGELIDGHTAIFNSSGHEKAGKSVFRLVVPQSWQPSESEMPETIQEFTSYCGTGSEKILIVAHDASVTDKDFFSEASIREMVPPETTLYRIENISLDGRPGVMTETEQPIYFKNSRLKIRMLQFMFAAGNKLFCVQCGVYRALPSEALEPGLKKIEPLCRLVAEGIRIEQ
jgi:hypothetical protein